MKLHAIWVICALLFGASASQSGELSLSWPRLVSDQKTFVYEDRIDSTFVLGNVNPPGGLLLINGQKVACDHFGAFLAYLPLRTESETKQWDLLLIEQGEDSARLSFPYLLQSDLPPEPFDSLGVSLPAVARVSQLNSHLRTAPGGSYYLFPEVDTRLQALDYDGRFLTIRLGAGTAAIERRFVEFVSNDSLPELRLGDGNCVIEDQWSVCRFELSAPVVWRAELTQDMRTLRVLLYDAVSELDRIRFDGKDEFLRNILWRQTPDGLELEFQFTQPAAHGYRVNCSEGELQVGVRRPLAASEHRLKGRRIVVDAGHGGDADGAIGPLGNREKDVTLRWSELLQTELERRGAVVVRTREYDETLGLYERIAIAEGVDADFFLSLHGNALPDGKNPAERKGTGTYYYQCHSRRPAEILHRQLLDAGKLNDDGLFDANFAVARPTAYPAVLIEAAYMMHPEEERLLINDEFLEKLSRALAAGLEEYFRTEP